MTATVTYQSDEDKEVAARALRLQLAASIAAGLLAMPRYRDREMPPPREVIPEALRYADYLIAHVDEGN